MRATWGVAILATGLALSGCGAQVPTPQPTPSSSASGEASATPTPTPRELNLEGTATDNLPYFDDTNNALIAAGGPFDAARSSTTW